MLRNEIESIVGKEKLCTEWTANKLTIYCEWKRIPWGCWQLHQEMNNLFRLQLKDKFKSNIVLQERYEDYGLDIKPDICFDVAISIAIPERVSESMLRKVLQEECGIDC